MAQFITPKCCFAVMESKTVFLEHPFAREMDYLQEPAWFTKGHNDLGSFIFPAWFCPHCGTKLPDIELRDPPVERLCTVTDGGYYCDTCRKRLNQCECSPPVFRWQVKS